MPNQVPLGIKVPKPTALPFPLLHTVLSKVSQAAGIRRTNRLRRMRLRDADQRNLFSAPTRPACRRFDPLSYPHEIFDHNISAHASQQPSSPSLPHYFVTSLLRFLLFLHQDTTQPVAALRVSS